jgi:hypothetical protein
MTEINLFCFFVFFKSGVVITGQLRWIAHMLRELIEADSFI